MDEAVAGHGVSHKLRQVEGLPDKSGWLLIFIEALFGSRAHLGGWMKAETRCGGVWRGHDRGSGICFLGC